MLIPVTTVQSGGGAGATKLLSTTTLGSAGTFDVSSIDQGYNDLIVIAMLRGSDAATNDTLIVRFNNDSGANYDIQTVNASGNAVGAAELFNQTGLNNVSKIVAAGGLASAFTFVRFEVAGYVSTTWKKPVQMLFSFEDSAAGFGMNARFTTALWKSTAAVNRLQLLGATTSNFVTGSQVRIYGRL